MTYKNIVKSTVVFGGVKVVEMLVTIIRLKIVAVFLGPEGMGVQSLFQSTLASLNQFSSLGIFQSSVRDISLAYESQNVGQIGRIVKHVKRWTFFVSLLGGLLCLIFSKSLSLLVFNNTEHVWSFALLSLAVCFWSLSNGRIAIMQGCRQIKNLANASLLGAILSLLLVIPLYVKFGQKGIVPALVLFYFSMYVVNYFFQNKNKLQNSVETIPLKESLKGGQAIVKLGVVLMLGNLLMTLFSLLTNIFIRKYGNIEDIGLFQAAFTITYGNLIVLMAVLTSDFYPRLSAVYNDNDQVRLLVNQQSEFLLLVIAPVTILLIIVAPLLVSVMYSKEFAIIVPMLRWMALALLFRIVWHSLSYVILAKGDKRTYFIYDALLGNGVNFVLNILAYYFGGLNGLGVSFVVGAVLMAGLLLCVTNMKYGFKFDKSFIVIFFSILISCMLGCILILYWESIYGYLICVCIFFIVSSVSLSILNSRIGLWGILKRKFLF